MRQDLVIIKQSADAAREYADAAREYAESIIDTVREPLIVLDHELRVVTASRFFYEIFKVNPEETVGQLIYNLGNKQWDIPGLRELLETILPQKTSFDNYEVEHDFAAIGKRIMLLNARQISRLWGKERVILLAIEDITERRRLEKKQEKFDGVLKEELERFTYTISHDLKSPLVTIKTFLGYLKQDIAGSDAGRIEQDMRYMHVAADKMGNLLGELLEMSRIGSAVNPAVAVTFQELAQETLILVAGHIEQRQVNVHVYDETLTLYGDRPRLVEIWLNLVENAAKFMGDQQSPLIDIGVEHRSDETVFFVRDNGIGIEPKYQPKVFNLFEKLDPGIEGSGMGLAIAKRIVELYQGKIWLESQGLGQGTCFRFTLPGALKS